MNSSECIQIVLDDVGMCLVVMRSGGRAAVCQCVSGIDLHVGEIVSRCFDGWFGKFGSGSWWRVVV